MEIYRRKGEEILAKSETGLKGLRSMAQFFESHAGLDAYELADRYGYSVCPTQFSLCEGKLASKDKRIFVSLEGPEILREFTVFHEMGHHSLEGADGIFQDVMLEAEIANDIEYWCDHFGIAMFFAKRNVRLMKADDAIEFLTHGNDAAYDGRDSAAPWRQAKILAHRIPSFARGNFKPGTKEYRECMFLKQALLLCAEAIRMRDYED